MASEQNLTRENESEETLDMNGVLQILERLKQGFQTKNHEMLAALFTETGQWKAHAEDPNQQYVGKGDIEEYLSREFEQKGNVTLHYFLDTIHFDPKQGVEFMEWVLSFKELREAGQSDVRQIAYVPGIIIKFENNQISYLECYAKNWMKHLVTPDDENEEKKSSRRRYTRKRRNRRNGHKNNGKRSRNGGRKGRNGRKSRDKNGGKGKRKPNNGHKNEKKVSSDGPTAEPNPNLSNTTENMSTETPRVILNDENIEQPISSPSSERKSKSSSSKNGGKLDSKNNRSSRKRKNDKNVQGVRSYRSGRNSGRYDGRNSGRYNGRSGGRKNDRRGSRRGRNQKQRVPWICSVCSERNSSDLSECKKCGKLFQFAKDFREQKPKREKMDESHHQNYTTHHDDNHEEN